MPYTLKYINMSQTQKKGKLPPSNCRTLNLIAQPTAAAPEDWRAVFPVVIGVCLRPSQTCKCTREYLFRTLQKKGRFSSRYRILPQTHADVLKHLWLPIPPSPKEPGTATLMGRSYRGRRNRLPLLPWLECRHARLYLNLSKIAM